MARQGISTGSSPNSGTGDTLIQGAVKINANFQEIYNNLGNGTNLSTWITNQVGIYTSSNIGIGTTNPSSKLQVIGDISVGVNTSQGVILTSPNGTKYKLFVNDSGTLGTISV